MAYTNFEIDRSLASMVILVDTREKPTKMLKDRMEMTGLPYERRKLDVGDYSCACTLPDGSELDFSRHVVLERKLSLDELCMCFGKERKRFEREFERAKEAGTKIYLLVEGGAWEKVYNGKYRSLYNPKALVASIDAYRARYGMQLDFCKAETTGKVIRDILWRELKEYLSEVDT
ncbi:MAG: ERCC4 domain-containing protein [Clostridiales bacterium]|nr:ERCC4 domain-containing protein [Clostridiales bacterium]